MWQIWYFITVIVLGISLLITVDINFFNWKWSFEWAYCFFPLALFFILLYSFCVQVSIEVKITAGFPIRQVILQEVVACEASWVVLDRYSISLIHLNLIVFWLFLSTVVDSFLAFVSFILQPNLLLYWPFIFLFLNSWILINYLCAIPSIVNLRTTFSYL